MTRFEVVHMPRTGGAYLAIYEKLRKQITEGTFPYGTRFPSKRTTAEENGVSVITAEHAYAILVEEGYLISRQRSGYFVAYRENDLMPVTQIKRAQVASSLTGDDTSLPFPQYARAVRRVLNTYGERLLMLSPGEGTQELREAIASYLAVSRNLHVTSSQIIIGSGAEYLYSLIVQLLGRNKSYAVEDPSYEKISRTYALQGVTIDRLAMGADGILTVCLENTAAQVLHVTPFHSYPSGITASASKRREYVRWAENHNAYLIEDDYDSALSCSSKAEDTLFSLDTHHRVIYLNTFSKTVAGSIRVGYMVLPEDLMCQYQTKLGFMSCTVPVFEQLLLTDLLTSGEYVRHINRVRRKRRSSPDPLPDTEKG